MNVCDNVDACVNVCMQMNVHVCIRGCSHVSFHLSFIHKCPVWDNICYIRHGSVIRCHSVSFGVIRCHSVSFGVIRCHSVSFGVIRCHPVSNSVSFMRQPHHTSPISHRHTGNWGGLKGRAWESSLGRDAPLHGHRL